MHLRSLFIILIIKFATSNTAEFLTSNPMVTSTSNPVITSTTVVTNSVENFTTTWIPLLDSISKTNLTLSNICTIRKKNTRTIVSGIDVTNLENAVNF
jgi:hypothetical protein